MVAIKLPRLAALALASAASLLLLTSCAGGSDESAPTEGSADVQDLDNWGENMEKCLLDKGWEIEMLPDGGINVTVPKGQEDSYDADYKACEESFGYDTPPVYSDEEVREIYKQVVATAECLTEQGQDPGAPPSEQTFVEQVQSGPGGWDPYSELYPATMDQQEYYATLEVCPRTWH